MAESAVFSLASKLMSTLASPAIQKAYEKVCSIRDARDELNKLRVSVETIHAVLLDAERKQEGYQGYAVRNWIKRVKGVLYDADDLFDSVATDDMLKQQFKIKGNKFLNKVRVSCSRLNPIISSNSIAQKVKDVRKSLDEISRDMAHFGFIICHREEPMHSGLRIGHDPGSFVDPKLVFGRDEDKKALLGMLINNESENAEIDFPLIIAIVGIGGMGKTTLAQLVFNDEEVEKIFEKRWFACISDTSDDKVITGKIFQSLCGKTYGDSTLDQLLSGIRESIKGKKFLLVLDDVWDIDHGRWQSQRSLFSGGAKGSMIIVTTRSSAVARAADALKTTHALRGLSDEDSWSLFKRVAFSPGQEKDTRWTSLGKEIVKKCANVPLVIRSIGSLLHTKSTIQEWESFTKGDLSKLKQNGDDPIMPILKLSYDHLSSNLKQCFAYCSLFPKASKLYKEDLIYLWIAQGYIVSDNATQTVEEVGHSYFMDLLRRSFFQDMEEGHYSYCRMHDIIHDLAQHVAGEECSMFTKSSSKEVVRVTRHVSVESGLDDSLVAAIINVNHIRSFMFKYGDSIVCRPNLVEECVNLKYLRTLSLPFLRIQNVSTSIGDLKHLRYLDISGNTFKNLPDSITKLLNLCTLNICYCHELETLPGDFRRLINLRHLENIVCPSLKYMPPGFKELISLQSLDEFKVGGEMNQLNALGQMRLVGVLDIHFENDTNDEWDGVECWQPPVNLQKLIIHEYNGTRIPRWGNVSKVSPKLTVLRLYNCSRVKCLPPLFFRHIPSLMSLDLALLHKLEYIEEDDGARNSYALFLPPLKKLEIYLLPKLKGWWGKVGVETRNEQGYSSSASHQPFPLFLSLSSLEISFCEELEWMPLCPCLARLTVYEVNGNWISKFLSTSSPSLKHLDIQFSDALQCLSNLKDVVWANLSNLKYLRIRGCPVLLEEDYNCVDWDSLPKLINLLVDKVPPPERLPNSLRNRQANGILQITHYWVTCKCCTST